MRDETGYRMGMAREDWVVSVDFIRGIYSKCQTIENLPQRSSV